MSLTNHQEQTQSKELFCDEEVNEASVFLAWVTKECKNQRLYLKSQEIWSEGPDLRICRWMAIEGPP